MTSLISAFELSMSPTEVNFHEKTNTEQCKEITITTTKQSILIGQDKWSAKGITEKTFSLHNLSSKNLDLEIDYPTNFNLIGTSNIDICITAEKQGIYHGLLLYKTKESSAGVGIWLNLNITKSENVVLQKITGNTISIQKNQSQTLLIIFPILLSLLLILLIRLNQKKRNK
ncbi:MAG: hypothetical protein OQK82_01630 [Candidatus Pacearchaeota archaeon]|nr:hypothetical protein [Candidatus Pacearchaeota archaeon]